MLMNLANYQDRVYCFVSEDLKYRSCFFRKERLTEWLDDHGIEQGHMSSRTWVKFIKESKFDTMYPHIPQGFVREDISIDIPNPSNDFEIVSASESARILDITPSKLKLLIDSGDFPAHEFFDDKRIYWRKETIEYYKEGYRKSNIIDVMKITTKDQYDSISERIESLEKIYISTKNQSIYLNQKNNFEKLL